MCYLYREQQAGAAERGGATPLPSLDRLRPRLIGAVAAVLIGGLAVAAIVTPPSASPFLNAKDATMPTTAVVEQGSAPVDDGVPSTSDGVKAGMGYCDHGL